MAYLKARDARAMKADERNVRLKELRQELMHERGVAAMGGSPPSPGKIRQLRSQIARVLTMQREDELGIPTARAAQKPKKAAKTGEAKPGRAQARRAA